MELTSTGQMMGTVDYMAPEQTGDSHAVDIRADIYGLGATLFKLLCNRAPYADARYDTVLKKLKAMATQPVPSIQNERNKVPDQLAAVLEKMLATEPDERLATPQEVAEALAPFAEGANLAALSARYDEAQQAADDAAGAAERSGRSTDEHLSCSMTETQSAVDERDERHGRTGLHPVPDRLETRPTEEEPVGQAMPDEMDLSAHSEVPLPSRGEARRGVETPSKDQPRPQPAPTRWNRNTKIAAIVLGLAGLFAGAMVIHLATDKGEIKIVAYDPEIKVTIKRNNEPIDHFRIKQRPDATSYYSGDYEIEISGGTPDGVKIENETFQLTRGKDVLVEIVHVGQAVPGPFNVN